MPVELWGPIDIRSWRSTPVVNGRVATEADVERGCAAFYIAPGTSRPYDLPLPFPAIVREEGIGEPTPVILIQAEELDAETVAVGYRFVDGGNGLCTLAECELLTEPDERFQATASN
jgi:hypothetical protein